MNDYFDREVLISTQWLANHLEDDNLRVIEVEMSPEPLKGAHIPGTIFWNIFTDLLTPNLSQNLDPAAMSALLSRSGIAPNTTIVAYGSELATGAWMFWLLKLFGHDRVRVLNGGHAKWIQESRPTVDSFATVAPTEYPIPQLDNSSRAAYSFVRSHFDKPQQVLLDVRTEQEYNGQHFMMKPPEGKERAGHIPGAHHIEHLSVFNDDGAYKSFDALKALYAARGITPDKTIIPYCAIGARSASVWFVLTHLLGYPSVLNYDGSWNEWSRQPEAPVSTSPAPPEYIDL